MSERFVFFLQFENYVYVYVYRIIIFPFNIIPNTITSRSKKMRFLYKFQQKTMFVWGKLQRLVSSL